MPTNNLEHLATDDDILDEIETIARAHKLAWHLQIGAVFLRRFWQDDVHLFTNRATTKERRFADFLARHADRLSIYELSERKLMDCVRGAIVLRQLPPQVAQKLFWSQVLELYRVHDLNLRGEVAIAAIEQDWSVKQLHDAVDIALAQGSDVDRSALADEVNARGALPAPADHDDPPPAPGRMVHRAETLVRDVLRWRGHWTQVDATKLRGPQRARLAAALATLKSEVAALEAAVGGGGGGEDGDGGGGADA